MKNVEKIPLEEYQDVYKFFRFLEEVIDKIENHGTVTLATGAAGLRMLQKIIDIQQPPFQSMINIGDVKVAITHLQSLDSAIDNTRRVKGTIFPASSYTALFYVGEEQVRAIKLFEDDTE